MVRKVVVMVVLREVVVMVVLIAAEELATSCSWRRLEFPFCSLEFLVSLEKKTVFFVRKAR